MQNRMKMMIEANQTLARIESVNDLLTHFMALGKEITDAEACSVMLYNPEKKVLEFKSVKDEIVGEEADDILKSTVELKVGEGIAGWVAKVREPVLVKDAQKDDRLYKQADQKTGFITRNLIAVPVLHQNELLGVIEALNSKSKTCFDDEDLDILEGFANLAAVAIIRARLLDFRLKQQKIQVQLNTASKIQSLFLPSISDIGSLEKIWALSEPAGSVGGDLYDIIPMRDESIFFYVGDVSDKGLPAALIMAALSFRIRGEVYRSKDVAKILGYVNDAMYELLSEEGYFATIILGKYWPLKGSMHLVNAGHLPPIRIINNEVGEIPTVRGLPVGIDKNVCYQRTELSLSAGESVILLTDGVTEAENEAGELFGNKRIELCIKENEGSPVSKGIVKKVKEWRGRADVNDDLTILEIWR